MYLYIDSLLSGHHLGLDWTDQEQVIPLHVAAQFNRERNVALLMKGT